MEKSEALFLLKEILSQLEDGQNVDLRLIHLFAVMDEKDILPVILKQFLVYTERFITYFSKDEWPVKRVEAIAQYIQGQEYVKVLTGSIWDDFYDTPACHAFFMGIYYLESAIEYRKEKHVFIDFAASALESILSARVIDYWSVTNKQEWEHWNQAIQTPLSDTDLQEIASGERNISLRIMPEYVKTYSKNIDLEVAREIEAILFNSM